MKILCLTSWIPSGRWLWDYIPGNTDLVDFVYITHPKDRFPGYGKLLGYYQKFFYLAIKALPRLADYDVIVAWEGNAGLPIAFFRTLLRKTKPPMVILNFVLKGKPIFKTLGAVRYALRSVDCITCLSEGEIAYNAALLQQPSAKFVKLQGPYIDLDDGSPSRSSLNDYIFAAGRSHRDYGTLMEAVSNLPIKLIINARAFNVQGLTPPPNVTINPFLPPMEFHRLLRDARFAVVPLFEAKHASGETFMTQAMSLERAVIVTRTYSTAEMIEDGVSGLLVPPGDVVAMRAAIRRLLDDPDLVKRLGKKARSEYLSHWSFPAVASQVHQIVSRMVAQ